MTIKRNSKGFTIIEVMIALFIIVIHYCYSVRWYKERQPTPEQTLPEIKDKIISKIETTIINNFYKIKKVKGE